MIILERKWKQYWKAAAVLGFLVMAGFFYRGHDIREEEILEVTAEQNSEVQEDPEADPSQTAPAETCWIHICGQVAHPGVYELPKGSRVFQAVEAAGGFTENAEDGLLNLAGMVIDGMKITVLSKEEAKELTESERKSMTGETDSGSGETGRLVNINTASREELMTLKGIGASRAEDIIRYREECGEFQRIEDIMKVSGIKDAGFQKIKDSITV